MALKKSIRDNNRYNERDLVSRFREENARLRTDISRLRIEKARLREENTQLRKDNSRLQDELYFMHEELEEEQDISEFKDIELARNNAWYHILQEEHLRLHSD
jgi:regulator of replication initiation timing